VVPGKNCQADSAAREPRQNLLSHLTFGEWGCFMTVAEHRFALRVAK